MEITKIKELAKELNLNNIANLPLEMFESKLPNVEYLEHILSTEVKMRKEKNTIKQRKLSRLPQVTFFKKYNGITEWQLNKLKKLDWLNDEQNLIIIGNCGTGKTSLACMVGEEILARGCKVFYATCDYF